MEREMAQPILASRNRRRGTAHVSKQESTQQQETAKRHGKKRQDVVGEPRARGAALPGKPRHRTPAIVHDGERVVERRSTSWLEQAQPRQSQLLTDLFEELPINWADGDDDRGGFRRTVNGGVIGA